jgi:serine/threonine protein kinase
MLASNTVLQNRYHIVRQLGEGGMGTVYEAVDQRLRTTVAVKETRFTDARLRKQFEREAQLLAGLRHAALPRVIDHFEEGEGLYLVMDYIAGDDLWRMLQVKNGPFPVDEVLRWADQLLDALAYLHSQKPPVIHRDIKLHNLKLTADGEIILLDFGLAKGLVESSTAMLTTRTVLGFSLPYAPPEQILQIDDSWREHLSVTHPHEVERLRKLGTDHRSDLYSVGASMLHLLTNKIPTNSPTRAISVWSGRSDPLEKTVKECLPESYWKAMSTVMALEPDERYSSAAEMREAMQRAGRASTPSKIETDTPEREPSGSAITIPMVTPHTPVAATVVDRSYTAKTWRDEAATAAAPTLVSQPQPPIHNQPGLKQPVSPVLKFKSRIWAASGVVALLVVGVMIYVGGRSLSPNNSVTSPAENPTSNLVNRAPAKWALKQAIEASTSVTVFSPDGKYLAYDPDQKIVLLNLASGKIDRTIDYANVTDLEFAPDSKTFVTSSTDPNVKIWDVATGSQKQNFKVGSYTINVAAYSPDGKTVAFDANNGYFTIWNWQTGERKNTKQEHAEYPSDLDFSPDGSILASCGSYETTVAIWNAKTGELIRKLEGHTGEVEKVAFSPDGKTLASGSDDETIILWDVATGARIRTLQNGERVGSIAFHPDGSIIAAGGFDKFAIKIWEVQTGTLRQTLEGHTSLVWSMDFSPDGRLLVSAGSLKDVRLWQAAN